MAETSLITSCGLTGDSSRPCSILNCYSSSCRDGLASVLARSTERKAKSATVRYDTAPGCGGKACFRTQYDGEEDWCLDKVQSRRGVDKWCIQLEADTNTTVLIKLQAVGDACLHEIRTRVSEIILNWYFQVSSSL